MANSVYSLKQIAHHENNCIRIIDITLGASYIWNKLFPRIVG